PCERLVHQLIRRMDAPPAEELDQSYAHALVRLARPRPVDGEKMEQALPRLRVERTRARAPGTLHCIPHTTYCLHHDMHLLFDHDPSGRTITKECCVRAIVVGVLALGLGPVAAADPSPTAPTWAEIQHLQEAGKSGEA